MKIYSKVRKMIVLLFVLMFVFVPFDSYAEINEVKNSVVRIYTPFTDGRNRGYAIGSGFYIGKMAGYQYYVTNDHVVTLRSDITGNLLQTVTQIVFSDLFTKTDMVEAEIVYQTYGMGADLAVLRIPDDGTEKRTPVTLKSCEDLKIASNVYALGFPAVVDELAGTDIALESTPEDVVVTPGSVSNLKKKVDNTDCVITTAVVNGGNSGGPLVADDDTVIGIVQWKGSDDIGLNGAIRSDVLIEILESKGFPYNIKDASADTADYKNSLETNKTGSVNNTDEKSKTGSKEGIELPSITEETKIGIYTVLGFILLLVLIFVLIIIFVMMNKSKQKNRKKDNSWMDGRKENRL